VEPSYKKWNPHITRMDSTSFFLVFWMRLKTEVQCVYTCRRSCTHYKDLVIWCQCSVDCRYTETPSKHEIWWG